MAMSAEQKEANKVARRDRDRAYRKRKRELRDVEDQRKILLESQFEPELRRLHAAEKAIEDACEAEMRAIDDQIMNLQAKREEMKALHRSKRQEAREPLSEAYARKREAEWQLERDLNEMFPDLTGQARWSVAFWSYRHGSTPSGTGEAKHG